MKPENMETPVRLLQFLAGMPRRMLPRWAGDIWGWFDIPLLPTVFILGLSPFLLYFISSAVNVGVAKSVWWDTRLVTNAEAIGPIVLFLFAMLAVFWMRTSHRETIGRKLSLTFGRWGRGLRVPLVFSAIAFYIPLALLAWKNALGSELENGWIVATPLIQSSFSVYLVVLSVTALIRYFFVTTAVQTGISGFTRNLTVDLERLVRKGKGHITISLPWLAFGKLSLDPYLFEDFRNALEASLSVENIYVDVYTLHENALRQGASKAIKNPANKLDAEIVQEFLKCELELRSLVEGRVTTAKQADLMACVIIDEKLYAVHTLLHKAQEYGHLGDAFISMEINDESICAEYRKRLRLDGPQAHVAA